MKEIAENNSPLTRCLQTSDVVFLIMSLITYYTTTVMILYFKVHLNNNQNQ